MPGYVKDTLHKFQKSTPQNISALYPPMGTSQLWFQHTPNGATTWQLTSDSSRIIQHSPSGSRNISVLCACRQPNHSGQNQQHSSLIIQNHTCNRKKLVQLLKYAATHPKAIIWYHNSGIILHMHSYTYFLPATGAKRRSGGYQYLRPPPENPDPLPQKQPPLNGPIHVECTTMKNVLASAMEAELGVLFVNCHIRAALKIDLNEMVHQKPPTPVATEISTGDRFVKKNIQQQILILINMIFYWVHNKVIQWHYLLYLERVKDNLANYFIKLHPTKRLRAIRST